MTKETVFASLAGPSAITIHNYGNMSGEFVFDDVFCCTHENGQKAFASLILEAVKSKK
jgi:S-adenosylmethionine/arginine decarboxylase-like enzyme